VWKITGIAVYLLILLGIGFLAARRMRDVKDYFAGGKRLGFWAVAFSTRATGESAWLLLGLTGMGAAVGVRGFFVVLGEVLGVAGAWLLMSKRFHRLTMRYDCITIPDYLEARFRDHGHLLRRVAAGSLVVFVTIYISAQVDATGKAFESFLGINYFAGALIGFAVVLCYSVAGGFLAAVWSDVFQGTLMFFGLVALPLVGIAALGGVDELSGRLGVIDPALMTWSGTSGGWTPEVVCGTIGLCFIGIGFLGSPQIFVRFLAMRSENEIRKGAAVAILWTLFADSGAVLIGMIGRALLTEPGVALDTVLGANGEAVLPELVDHLLPAVLVGIYMAIVLAAIMSTVDSLLIVAGSAAARDYYQKVRHPQMPDRELLATSRKITLFLAMLALSLAMFVAIRSEDRTIFWFVIFGWSGIAATFCPTMILSLFWKGMTARGALAAMLSGFLAVPLFKFAAPQLPVVGDAFAQLAELPPAFVLSGLAGVVVSLADKTGRARLEGIDRDLDAAAG
jgi:sodium/proline symporter